MTHVTTNIYSVFPKYIMSSLQLFFTVHGAHIIDGNSEHVALVRRKKVIFCCYCRSKQMPNRNQFIDFAQRVRTYF